MIKVNRVFYLFKDFNLFHDQLTFIMLISAVFLKFVWPFFLLVCDHSNPLFSCWNMDCLAYILYAKHQERRNEYFLYATNLCNTTKLFSHMGPGELGKKFSCSIGQAVYMVSHIPYELQMNLIFLLIHIYRL